MTTKNLPKISVITPVKNGAKSFEKAILSLIDQNYPNLEYLVMDGASTDGTLDIIKKYEKHITFWRSYDDGNTVVAQIEGFQKATGDIICILNCDDFYEPGTLKKIGEAFAEDPSLDIVSCRFRTLCRGKIIEESKFDDAILSADHLVQNIGVNARFFKRDIFDRYGGLPITHDDKGRTFISNDLEFISRFAILGVKNKLLDHVAYNYVAHEDSLTFSNNPNSILRLHEDRIFTAKRFLNDRSIKLTKIWEKQFQKWIKKYRCLLVIDSLKQKKWQKAKENFYTGIKENGALSFCFYLIKSALRKRVKPTMLR